MTTCAPLPRVTASASASRTASALADALQRMAADGVPAVLALDVDSPILPRWTPKEIRARVRLLTRVYESDTRRFGPFFDDARPMARQFRLAPAHNYSECDKTPHEFFDVSDHQRLVYYSGEVDRDLPNSMLEELRPLESALIARAPQRASVNLWLGGPWPVVAPCHYGTRHPAWCG